MLCFIYLTTFKYMIKNRKQNMNNEIKHFIVQ